MTTLEYLELFPIGYSLIFKKNLSKWTSITGLGSNIPTHKWCFFTVWYDLVQLAFPLQLVGLDYRLVVLPLLPWCHCKRVEQEQKSWFSACGCFSLQDEKVCFKGGWWQQSKIQESLGTRTAKCRRRHYLVCCITTKHIIYLAANISY